MLIGFTAGTESVWAQWKDHFALKMSKPFYRSNFDTPRFKGSGWMWIGKDRQFKKVLGRYLEHLMVTVTEKKAYMGSIS